MNFIESEFRDNDASIATVRRELSPRSRLFPATISRTKHETVDLRLPETVVRRTARFPSPVAFKKNIIHLRRRVRVRGQRLWRSHLSAANDTLALRAVPEAQ